jgi:hypothetical protein
MGAGAAPPAHAFAGLSGAPALPPPLLTGGTLGLLAEREEWLVCLGVGGCRELLLRVKTGRCSQVACRDFCLGLQRTMPAQRATAGPSGAKPIAPACPRALGPKGGWLAAEASLAADALDAILHGPGAWGAAASLQVSGRPAGHAFARDSKGRGKHHERRLCPVFPFPTAPSPPAQRSRSSPPAAANSTRPPRPRVCMNSWHPSCCRARASRRRRRWAWGGARLSMPRHPPPPLTLPSPLPLAIRTAPGPSLPRSPPHAPARPRIATWRRW